MADSSWYCNDFKSYFFSFIIYKIQSLGIIVDNPAILVFLGDIKSLEVLLGILGFIFY